MASALRTATAVAAGALPAGEERSLVELLAYGLCASFVPAAAALLLGIHAPCAPPPTGARACAVHVHVVSLATAVVEWQCSAVARRALADAIDEDTLEPAPLTIAASPLII